MTHYDPALSHFDLDRKRGAQAELWVSDVRDALAEKTERVEVKADSYYLSKHSENLAKQGRPPRFFVELECLRRGEWMPSGLNVTKAGLWVIKFGNHPAAVIVETAWLRRIYELVKDKPGRTGQCRYGRNPTRGFFVYMSDLLLTRDAKLDER